MLCELFMLCYTCEKLENIPKYSATEEWFKEL